LKDEDEEDEEDEEDFFMLEIVYNVICKLSTELERSIFEGTK